VISATRQALVDAFRRAALPLGSYYAITLLLPLVNGAAPSGTFVNHALVVAMVPPILVVLLCAARAGSQMLTALGRSAVVGFRRRLATFRGLPSA
jgi:hypothetical protein